MTYHNYTLVRWRVGKNKYHRAFRQWSVTLWDFSTTIPGSFFMETRHFFFAKNARAFAFSQEAEEIRQSHEKRLY